MPKTPLDTSISRYAAVALVLAKVAAGMTFSRAVRQVTKSPIRHVDGTSLRLSVRTLQRWVAAYQSGGLDALAPISRVSADASKVLSANFLAYLVQAKTGDPDASIPEVIRRAKEDGILDYAPSRVSVWRAARKLNLPIFATKGVEEKDMQRYEYAHRLQMVLADGKHFRSGLTGRKRVVITFLDDASRFALGAVVGTSESSALFLRGLWKVLLRWGLIEHFFLDNGSGFIAKDCAIVASRIKIGFIHGTAGYPEGHGKIERYHQTLIADLLRSFPANPEIDSDLGALELRIEHYLKTDYNRRIHESLAGLTPEQRFLADELQLRPIMDPDILRQHFLITDRRKVSRDNVIMVKRIPYEVPRGYAGTWIFVHRHLLDRTVSVMHEGRLVQLAKVDKILNSKTRRARPTHDQPARRPVKTAATLRFDHDHPPLVGDSGDFFDKE